VKKRYDQVDALRGLALMGILGVNTVTIAYGRQSVHLGQFFNGQGAGEQISMFFVAAFLEGKFYPIFAFLFGASFALQADSMRRDGIGLQDAHARMSRRMVALLAIGLLHGVLLYFGDILFSYAMAGLFLRDMLTKKSSAHIASLKRAAIYLAVLYLISLGMLIPEEHGKLQEALNESAEAFRLVGQGSWRDMTWSRIKDFGENQFGAFISLPLFYAYFLLGRLAVRQGWLTRPQRHRRQWRTVMWIGLGIGLPACLFNALATVDLALAPLEREVWHGFAAWLAMVLAPLLAGAYVAAFMLFWQRPPKAMQAMGKMALTNYLAQSVIGVALLQSPFLALGPGLSRPVLLLYCVLMIALQLWWSRAWLARYKQGPVEAIWRRYTHGDGKIEG
jgi:uncharacterized protein